MISFNAHCLCLKIGFESHQLPSLSFYCANFKRLYLKRRFGKIAPIPEHLKNLSFL